ncbi:MAG TPA: universal stress protein [Kofleriaceae bacterium]|nr:universal stress protein [Kofleriaceae bacterium]
MMNIRKILLPTDFSAPSKEAQIWGTELARRYDASLTLFHVYQPVSYALPEGYVLPSASLLADLEVKLGKSLDEAKAELDATPGLRVDTSLVQGVPFAEIVRFAREGAYDLIVIGTHGRTGLRHALLGSVAEKVVRKASCPVLTVRPPGLQFEHP